MNTTTRIIIAIVILLIIGAAAAWVWFYADQDNQNDQSNNTSPTSTPTVQLSTPTPTESETEPSPTQSGGEVTEVTVTNDGNSFSPESITVNQGDTVQITFQSTENVHTFTLPEFNVDTGNVNPGDAKMVEFVADSQGEFEFYCTIHRNMGMTGTLIVN